jgi:hypothetical protein
MLLIYVVMLFYVDMNGSQTEQIEISQALPFSLLDATLKRETPKPLGLISLTPRAL